MFIPCLSKQRQYWFPCKMKSQKRASDLSCCEGNLLQPIRSTTQIQVVTCP